MLEPFIALQIFVVLFIALHDWVPLGPFNDVQAVQAADSRARLMAVTILSTAPFALGLAGSVYYAHRSFPGWLLWCLWISYLTAAFGMLRTWWVPYLLVTDAARAGRYRAMFGRTHSFLPERRGIRPNTLHMLLHAAIVAILVMLAIMWRATRREG
jgi:hypothetical protein